MATLALKDTGRAASTTPKLGYSVSIDGNLAAAGAYTDDTVAADAGMVRVYERVGTVWTKVADITAPDGLASDYFGYSISIVGDLLAVGAIGCDDIAAQGGAVYVFRKGATAATWNFIRKITPSDAVARGINYLFGNTLALGQDSRHLIVGTYKALNRQSYIYDTTTWAESILVGGDDIDSDGFGQSVAIDKGRAAVSALGFNSNRGAVYVFELSGGVWSKVYKLTASDAQANDSFGTWVNVMDDAVAVGAVQSLGVPRNGAAYVYRGGGATWTEVRKLVAADGVANDKFGFRVRMNENKNVILIGANEHDTPEVNCGAAYLFDIRDGSQIDKLSPTGAPVTGDKFGQAVSISTRNGRLSMIVGASFDDTGTADAGAVYIYDDPCNYGAKSETLIMGL